MNALRLRSLLRNLKRIVANTIPNLLLKTDGWGFKRETAREKEDSLVVFGDTLSLQTKESKT